MSPRNYCSGCGTWWPHSDTCPRCRPNPPRQHWTIQFAWVAVILMACVLLVAIARWSAHQ